MRRLCTALLLAFALCRAAVAAPPSEASVLRLLDLTNAESMMGSMMEYIEQSMRAGMQQAVAGQRLTPQQQRALDLAPRKIVAAFREDLGWSTLKPMYVAIYQETFDQSEIDGLIAFYETPTGKALVAKMPIVMQKSMAAGQERMQRLLPRLQAAMQEALREAGVTR